MFKPGQLLCLGLIVLFSSCKNDNTHTYAIKDFRKALQPHLIKIVAKGIVMPYDSALHNMTTDKELMELSQSEHPALRAAAFRVILYRKSFDHFEILMNNLDDTAFILSDEGEFGISYGTISDDILEEAKWKTPEAKNRTVEEVLTKYNYLRSAYRILRRIEPQEKYYAFIKEMATRPRHLDSEGYEDGFDDIEYALYGLAKFKKKEDVQIIKQLLMKNVWLLSHISFNLMKEYPDTAYMDVFQSYYRRRFYEFSGNRRDGFTGFKADRADPEDFIEALAVQPGELSPKLFDTLLLHLRSMPCMPDKETIEDEIVMAIWEQPTSANAWLRKKIKTRAVTILKKHPESIYVEPYDRPFKPVDTTVETIGWYN
jgi:hypothetical protein